MQATLKYYPASVYAYVLLVLSYIAHYFPANGFFVKDCNIKGSLNYPEHLMALCNNTELQRTPENLPIQTRILDLSHNQITHVKKKDLAYLTKLRHLNISDNMIQDVEENTFSSMTGLQELNLANNQLTTITETIFQNLFNLTLLRLDSNKITNISAPAFNPLISLRVLNLSHNYLYQIYEAQPVFQLLSIQELYIGSNGFTSFQTSEISNISLELKVLDLSGNPLQVFNISADILPQLKFLDLAFTNSSMTWDVWDKKYLGNVSSLNLSGISKTPQKMEPLLQTFNTSLHDLTLQYIGEKTVKPVVKTACLIKTLRSLYLQFNIITSISEDDLANCKNIVTLDLSENSLDQITSLAFRAMSKLNKLNLSHNKLIRIGDAIGNLSSLLMLDISYNDIHDLTHSDFNIMIHLHTLIISKNPLSSITQGAFQNLKNLTSLKIKSSRLFSATNYFKCCLHRLEHLDLAQNKLTSISKGDFGALYSLIYLHLNDNQITTIDEGSFNGLEKLKVLKLDSNKIKQNSLSVAVFAGLTNLIHLSLNNNYISYSDQAKLVEPPFTGLKHLDTLDIYEQGHKGMLNIPANFLNGLESLHAFKARKLSLKSLHPDTFTPTPNLWLLDISTNEPTSNFTQLFMPLQKLNKLDMSSTGLQSLDFIVQANLNEIRYLKLSSNPLAVVSETVISTMDKLIYIDLEDKTFTCDCSNAWFVNWAKTNNRTQVINADKLTCNYPSKLRGNELMDLDLESCIVDVGFNCFISTTILVGLIMLNSIFYRFLKWKVVYAYYRLLAFLYDSKQRNEKLSSFQYDAFISYNTHDELWVMSELLPQLEGQQGWRLCLHHRDFQPGKPIMDNIVDGIYGSRKTICVISRHYLDSEWCSREIQVASFRLFDEKKDVLILVFLEDIPTPQLSPYYRMRKLIKKRTYLTWPKPGEDTRIFWQKLRVALETRGTSEEESTILSGLGRI